MPKTTAGAMEQYAINRHARRHGLAPERVQRVGDMVRTVPIEGGYRPLYLGGVLPPGNPLETTAEDRRRLRRRGL